jgi:STE24 endopeptidase
MQLQNIFTIVFLSFLFLSILIKILLDFINYYHRKKYQNVVPKELDGFIDQEKLVKINKYSNVKLAFSLIEYFFDNALLLCILFFGIIPFYYNFLITKFNNIYILVLVFFAGYYLLQLILGIPFSLYFNFVIEKKFQFNKMTIGLWISDFFKGFLITAVLGVIILISLVFFINTFSNYWWLLLWGFFFGFSLLMQIIYPTFIAPLFNKFKPLEKAELKVEIEKLLNNSSLKSKGVYEMDATKRSTHSNAYFTGIGKAKRIVLFDSLLKKHTDQEILAILAHEIGHYKFKHVIQNLILSLITSLAGLYIAYFLINNTKLYEAFGFANFTDINKLKFVGLFLLSIIIGPIFFFLSPLSAYISRKHEFQADKFSFKMMNNNPQALIDALKKLSIENLSNLYPHDLYAWFYYSHPPLFKRIKTLQNLK